MYFMVVRDEQMDMNILHISSGMDTIHRDMVITHLLDTHRMDPNVQSGTGNDKWTAGHMCCCWGYHKTLELLLNKSADPFVIDSRGMNFWDVAQVYDNFQCIFILENHVVPQDPNSIQTEEDDGDDRPSCTLSTSIQKINLSKRGSRITSYHDKKFGITFLEEHSFRDGVTGCNPHEPVSRSIVTIDETILNLNDERLREKLFDYGESPGPIVPTTRRLYQLRLQHLKKKQIFPSQLTPDASGDNNNCDVNHEIKPNDSMIKYSVQLRSISQETFDFRSAKRLEEEFNGFFKSDRNKYYFTYLLIDPRVTQRIPGEDLSFEKFIQSIFYVGKGQGKRPLMHLYEAALFERNLKNRNVNNICKNEKISKILEIWGQNYGVVSLHCFHNISSDEALARESMMIEALGLSNLTNIQIGQKKTIELGWNTNRKKILGSLFLHRAFRILDFEGERQIKRTDVRR